MFLVVVDFKCFVIFGYFICYWFVEIGCVCWGECKFFQQYCQFFQFWVGLLMMYNIWVGIVIYCLGDVVVCQFVSKGISIKLQFVLCYMCGLFFQFGMLCQQQLVNFVGLVVVNCCIVGFIVEVDVGVSCKQCFDIGFIIYFDCQYQWVEIVGGKLVYFCVVLCQCCDYCRCFLICCYLQCCEFFMVWLIYFYFGG